MEQEKRLTGYPSIDRPWLKYYSEEAINAELPNETLYENLKNNNKNNLNSIALKYYGAEISYASLIHNIDRVAGALTHYGVCKGDTVTVCSLNSPETIYLLYGINKIGAVANMASGLSDSKEMIKYINDTGSKLLIILDVFQDKIASIIDFTSIEKVVVMNLSESMGIITRIVARFLKGMKPKVLPRDSRFVRWKDFVTDAVQTDSVGKAEDVAVITYTGGTTGGAKGAMLSNRAVLATTYQYILCNTQMERGQTWLQFFPLFIAYGVGPSLHLPLMAGLTLIIRIPMADRLCDIIKKYKPNHILSGPAMWVQLAEDEKDLDLSFLIEPVSGGDKLPIHLEEKVNAYFKKQGADYPLMNGYGLTEVSAGVSINFKNAYRLGSVGVPFCKNIIAAFDLKTGKELCYGEEGEICICTPSLMTGYVNGSDEMICTHEDGLNWLHSGDLGYVSQDGFVFITGRLKRYFLYIANGEQRKVFSADIEKLLLTHPLVENCAVIPISHKIKNQVAKAYIKLRDKTIDTVYAEQELRDFCNNKMPDRFRPETYKFVQAFPMTKLGKVDYRALEDETLQADLKVHR